VIDVGVAARDDAATAGSLALVVVPQQHFPPRGLPPLRAVASSGCRWPIRIWCPWPLALPNPRRLERRQPIGHVSPS
jgi:hypothetical protein